MENYVEYIGYAASVVLLLSFLMKEITKLRVVNMMACGLFIVYGFYLPGIAWPVIISNAAILGVNLYYLMKTKPTA